MVLVAIDLLDKAHADGLEIRGQVATRAVGLLLDRDLLQLAGDRVDQESPDPDRP